MQLTWSDVLKDKPWCLEIMKVYFTAMQSMNCGKASTHFMEKAQELGNIVLKNQIFQTTRFVQSLQRGITTGLRNLPTLVSIIAEDFEEATLQHENTRAKELKKVLDSLMSAETLFFSIGMSQLL